MKKIIPFKKDIIFKTNVSEITSISLEHTLHFNQNNSVGGEFTVSGEYKITDTSINVEPFSYNLPFDINLDEKYIVESANIDINDFYYEIINDNVLSVNIEVVMDGLEERLLPKEPVREVLATEEAKVVEPIESTKREETIEETILETFQPNKEEVASLLEEIETSAQVNEATLEREETGDSMEFTESIPLEETSRCIEPEDTQIGSLFDHMDDTTETYQSYKVYIVREGDTLEAILEKYSITKEELESYNDLREMKLGDKIIIPTTHA